MIDRTAWLRWGSWCPIVWRTGTRLRERGVHQLGRSPVALLSS